MRPRWPSRGGHERASFPLRRDRRNQPLRTRGPRRQLGGVRVRILRRSPSGSPEERQGRGRTHVHLRRLGGGLDAGRRQWLAPQPSGEPEDRPMTYYLTAQGYERALQLLAAWWFSPTGECAYPM